MLSDVSVFLLKYGVRSIVVFHKSFHCVQSQAYRCQLLSTRYTSHTVGLAGKSFTVATFPLYTNTPLISALITLFASIVILVHAVSISCFNASQASTYCLVVGWYGAVGLNGVVYVFVGSINEFDLAD
jgi:hypothetical protein